MRERVRAIWRRVASLEGPDLTPATWTVAVFLGVLLGDGVRGRAARGPISGDEADLLGLLVCIGFVSFVAVAAVVVEQVRDRR